MPKRIAPLSDARVGKAKPTDKEYKIADGGSLHLLVTPSGGKLWRLKYRFEGKVTGAMDIYRESEKKTKVHFDMKVEVHFLLYPAFRIVPKKIVRTMVNGGMTFIMQTATNSMFHSMSKDFCKIHKI